jgi:hypothetical protein
MVGHVEAFLKLIRDALPKLLEAFESASRLFSIASEAALGDLYSGIRAASFSDEVLAVQSNDLAVLRATGLGWSDLGEPGRVRSLIERGGIRTEWRFSAAREEVGSAQAYKQAVG